MRGAPAARHGCSSVLLNPARSGSPAAARPAASRRRSHSRVAQHRASPLAEPRQQRRLGLAVDEGGLDRRARHRRQRLVVHAEMPRGNVVFVLEAGPEIGRIVGIQRHLAAGRPQLPETDGSAKPAKTLSAMLEPGQHSSTTPSAAMRRTRSGFSIARTPWPMRLGRMMVERGLRRFPSRPVRRHGR